MGTRTGGWALNLEHELDVSPEVVFRMLTEPAELKRWWGPRGFTLPEAEVDLAVGGRYRFRMAPPEGDPFHLSGEFLRVERPTRLVYTFNWEEPVPDDRQTTVDVALHASGEGTQLVLEQGLFLTEERLLLHRNGWTESLGKLGDAVRSRA